MNNTVRWNVGVSQDTDQAVRLFLASKPRSKKGDLSHFIEESVRAHIFDLTANQIKSENTDIKENDLLSIVEESIEWARNQ